MSIVHGHNDMHQILTAMKEIHDLADFDPEGMGAMDLGDLLTEIQGIAEHELLAAGWSIERPEVEDETDDD